jgi:hypothetical protein
MRPQTSVYPVRWGDKTNCLAPGLTLRFLTLFRRDVQSARGLNIREVGVLAHGNSHLAKNENCRIGLWTKTVCDKDKLSRVLHITCELPIMFGKAVIIQEPLKPRTNVSCRFLANQLAIRFLLFNISYHWIRMVRIKHTLLFVAIWCYMSKCKLF